MSSSSVSNSSSSSSSATDWAVAPSSIASLTLSLSHSRRLVLQHAANISRTVYFCLRARFDHWPKIGNLLTDNTAAWSIMDVCEYFRTFKRCLKMTRAARFIPTHRGHFYLQYYELLSPSSALFLKTTSNTKRVSDRSKPSFQYI